LKLNEEIVSRNDQKVAVAISEGAPQTETFPDGELAAQHRRQYSKPLMSIDIIQ